MPALYNGSVELTMDARHVYRARIDGGKSIIAPNVTSILSQKDKSRALIPWALGCAADYVKGIIPVGTRFRMDEVQMSSLVEGIKGASNRVSNTALTVGSVVHSFAEETLLAIADGRGERPTMPTHAQAKRGCEAFLQWLDQHHVEPLHIERMIFSKKFGYAGTCDFVGRIDNTLTVADFKTSRGIYDEHLMQTAAYWTALEEELGLGIDARAILRFDKETGEFDFHRLPMDTIDMDFEAFLACRTLYHYDREARKTLAAIREAA